jgi:hypothetical protein
MNNKEEVLTLAEMQLKSLGFIDSKVISQSLNIDVEYVNQVIENDCLLKAIQKNEGKVIV